MTESFKDRLNVSRETSTLFSRYTTLLLQWNRRINLIGQSTEPSIIQRHIDDSQQLELHIPETGSLVDIGSGAGFPGLVLALLKPHLTIHLIESDKRKAAFLLEASRQLDLGNVIIHNKRAEAIHDIKADIVTARGCAPLHLLLELAEGFLHSSSFCLFPKGRNYSTELEAVTGWRFTLETFPSRTDPSGVLLKLYHLERHP